MEDSIKELSGYRFECSKEAIEDAKIMFDNSRYKNALNRAYYAIFYALRAVMQKADYRNRLVRKQ